MNALLRRLVLCAGLLLPGLAVCAETWFASARAKLVIDAEGRVATAELSRNVEERVGAAVLQRLRGWRFEPVLEQGRPVPAEAHVHLQLYARHAPDEVRIGIAQAHFVDPPGRGQASGLLPARYPAETLRAGIGAHLDLRVEVAGDGRVLRVGTERAWLYHHRKAPRQPELHFRRLEKAVHSAVLRSRLPPDPEGRVRQYTLPSEFRQVLGVVEDMPTGWSRGHPLPVVPQPWFESATDEVAALAPNGRRVDPRFRLIGGPDLAPSDG